MMNLNRTGKRMGALSWVLILAFLLTSLGQVNGVVLAQDEVPTETPAVTEETPMPEVSQTPAIPAEPTEILPTETPIDPFPTETETVVPTEENGSDVEALEDAPANDLIPNAIVMALDNVYTANSAGATISTASEGAELADPANVCNAGDTYSLWYEFTAPADGVYVIDTYGSELQNRRNITIMQVETDALRIPVVCGRTNLYGIDDVEYFKLAFNAEVNTTYLIGVSGTSEEDSIFVQLKEYVCETGHLCGAGVNGDGSAMDRPYIDLFDKNYSMYLRNFFIGEKSGLIDVYLESTPEIPF